MYFDSYNNPISSWLRNRHPDYDSLPQLFSLFEEQLPKKSYYKTTIIAEVLTYVNKIVKHFRLENDLELVKEYYDICLNINNLNRGYNNTQLVNEVLFISECKNGQDILKEYGIDFTKHSSKWRMAVYERCFESSSFLDIKKATQYRPKVIDSKKLLQEKLSLTLCVFLVDNDIEIPKNYLCQLANIIFNKFNCVNGLQILDKTHDLDRFAYVLMKSSSFSDYIAPVKNLNLAIYHYFDRVFPIPKDLNMMLSELEDPEKYQIYLINEFSRRLYNNPAYGYLNINTKFNQKINLKYSGKKFVSTEEQEINLQREKEIQVVVKRNKI